MSNVYAIATMDTKGEELQYLANTIKASGVPVITVDVGTLQDPKQTPDISRSQVFAQDLHQLGDDRGTAVTRMGQALGQFLTQEVAAGKVSGVIGIGGSGGTALITAAMRMLPIGLPKLMVSTVASGNTAPYVDCSDITMMFSIVDVAGINAVSARIFANAAHAISGMVQHSVPQIRNRPTLGMTMFGVTTPCVTRVRQALANDYDCLVFHATGTGGRAMENLIASDWIDAVLDLTTTEVADEIVGGVFSAGPHRMEIAISKELPLVVSLGAVDMVNFGARDSVPDQFQDRLFHIHNAQVTLMRTTADENRRIGTWIVEKLNKAKGPVTLVIPEGGVSMLDAPGQPFHDPIANQALFDTIQSHWQLAGNRNLIRSPHHINDPEFADILVEEFRKLILQKG